MKAIVSAKGVVTIPKSLREQMGIRPGFAVDFAAKDGRLIGVVLDPSDPIDAMFGAFPSSQSTDERIEELRGPVDLP